MNTRSLRISSTDEELHQRLRRGDHDAFHLIYEAYWTSLYQFVVRNVLVKEDSEEIIQEVFASLWQRRHDLEIQSLRHYLFNAVRYKVIRYFSHEKTKRKYADHYRIFEVIYNASSEPERDPEILQQKINTCIDKLPERCRMVIKLRLSENLSNSEIAERMNITKKTVEQHLVRIFNHIRAFEKELLQSSLGE